MEITEKLQNGWYLGTPTGQNNRMILHSNEVLIIGQKISKDNPIDLDYCETLCSLCNEIFGKDEEYEESWKQSAIDYKAGYITCEEMKFELNID